ncbi:unnamed protein product [Polarella glacialis]|uniref:Uncharacterized protein n=1 Tax=Polarella glacialis TaxID=89957 RepID=A0A813LBF2_POLGL|nr:unnamed protein product [Polarella glacialis]
MIQSNDMEATWSLLSQAVFCPVPAGDNPPTVRFFRAILSGCIPVNFTSLDGNATLIPEDILVLAPSFGILPGKSGRPGADGTALCWGSRAFQSTSLYEIKLQCRGLSTVCRCH